MTDNVIIEKWKKDTTVIIFGVKEGVIITANGRVKGMTREDLVFNGWKQIIDNEDEEWEDVTNEK